MSENTSVEWATHSFNTHWGCHEISDGCTNCYARGMGNRFGVQWGVDTPRREFGDKHWDEPLKWDRKAAAAGEKHYVFSNSMSDLFDKNAPAGVRERWFALTKATPNLIWLALTKRVGNVPSMLPADWGNGYPNVWLGISVVNQPEADRDIPKLERINAAVRFLSMEPLLSAVDLQGHIPIERDRDGSWRRKTKFHEESQIHWIIVGGESGTSARPMHPDWAYSLRDQCKAAGVAFFFKQWGSWTSPGQPAFGTVKGRVAHIRSDGSFWDPPPDDENADCLTIVHVGTKAAGRLLGNEVYNEFPGPRP